MPAARPRPESPPTADELVRRLKALAEETGREDIAEHEFTRATGVSSYFIAMAFGRYSALRTAAGFKPARNTKLDNDTLLRALRDACFKAGGLPPSRFLGRFGAPAKATYYARWGNWRGTLAALRAWVEKNDPGFPYLTLLSAGPDQALPALRAPGVRYGAPLLVGPLLHEPTNELGVVALFGCLAPTLGFGIERLQPGFPDCEAKQRMVGGWRRVRIEFEFQSRNFERHRHDPEGCDLIVCWEHNWPQAPVEVLELRAVASRVSAGAAAVDSQKNWLSPRALSRGRLCGQ